MRYYFYIDKQFIKTIFASDGISNFDIDIITYSFQEGETIFKSNNFSPRVDYSEDEFKEKEKITEKDNNIKKKKKGDVRQRNDNSFEFSSGNSNTYNKTIEKRYINIEEVSDIKNMAFFDKMIKSIEGKCNSKNKLYLETGIIYPCTGILFCKSSEDNIFFCINGKFFWGDKKLLNCDINILNQIYANVTVCGFCLNPNSYNKMIKVIAIYI